MATRATDRQDTALQAFAVEERGAGLRSSVQGSPCWAVTVAGPSLTVPAQQSGCRTTTELVGALAALAGVGAPCARPGVLELNEPAFTYCKSSRR
jgi:hypothetical protein